MDLDKRFEKLLVNTGNVALIEAYTALKKQTVNAMNDAIKAIDVLERALEKAETSDSNCNIPHVSGSLPSDEELQEVVERIAYEQHGEDQADDCYAKMGILHEFVKTYVGGGNDR